MVNKARKGYIKEKKCRDELKEQGWTIMFKSVRWKFGCIDFGELFDVVAAKKNPKYPKHPDWRFISVKHLSNGNYHKPHQKELKRFAKMYGLDGMKFELWLWEAPRWKGRGKNKIYWKGGWHKLEM